MFCFVLSNKKNYNICFSFCGKNYNIWIRREHYGLMYIPEGQWE